MRIIKLDATCSTNLYLKNLSVEKQLVDFTTVVAKHQMKGRGQMGASWYSEKGKNLTFSVFKKIGNPVPSHPFAIGMCTGLAVYHCLQNNGVPDLAIKWPNDIMSGQKKICGILIENTFSAGTIKSSILGIGINVNQTDFIGMEKASSLKLLCGHNFDLEELLIDLIQELKDQLRCLGNNDFEDLKVVYEEVLFRKDKPSTFKSSDGTSFTGFIRGISDSGKLKVEVEGKKVLEFDLKEVSLLLN